jgi:hypothetical protein
MSRTNFTSPKQTALMALTMAAATLLAGSPRAHAEAPERQPTRAHAEASERQPTPAHAEAPREGDTAVGASARALADALDEWTITRAERGFAWLLGLRLDGRDRQIFRAGMIVDWQTASAAERARVEPRVALLETAQQVEPARRELARLTLAQATLAELRARPDTPLHHLLLTRHAAAHPPIAPGDPPLTREMTDALADLLGFVLFEAVGVAQSPVPAGVKADGAIHLANAWPALSRAEQERIARAPLQNAALRWRWSQLPESKRRLARAAWRRDLGPALAWRRSRPPAATSGARWARDLADLERRIEDHDRTIGVLRQLLDVRGGSSQVLVSQLVGSPRSAP